MPLFEYIEDFGGLEFNLQCEPLTDATLTAHIKRQTERMRRRTQLPSESQRKAFIIQDNTGFPGATASQRQMLAQWLKDEGDLMRMTVIGVAFVIDNALVRGALTAVFWLSRMPMPHTVHATLDHAIEHGLQRCQEGGIAVDDRLRQRGAACVYERAQLAYRRSPSGSPTAY